MPKAASIDTMKITSQEPANSAMITVSHALSLSDNLIQTATTAKGTTTSTLANAWPPANLASFQITKPVNHVQRTALSVNPVKYACSVTPLSLFIKFHTTETKLTAKKNVQLECSET